MEGPNAVGGWVVWFIVFFLDWVLWCLESSYRGGIAGGSDDRHKCFGEGSS